MGTSQTEIESKVLELASEAMETFCEDISGMFGVEMEYEQKEITTQTVAQLKKRFKKLMAVNIVDSKGVLDGTFQLIFDQEGLFTLGGIMVMLPEKRILENRKSASADLAESMVDAVGEAGNLLVGSWERIFREGLEGHGHLQQRLPAFVGKPWDEPQEKIGLSPDKEHILIPYKITISPYPAFNGGVILPKAIFEEKSESNSDDSEPTEEDVSQVAQKEQAVTENKNNAEPEAADARKKDGDTKSATEEKSVTETTAEPVDKEPDKEAEIADNEDKAESPEIVEKKVESAESDENPQDTTEEAVQEKDDSPAEQNDAAPEAGASEESSEEQSEIPELIEEPTTGPVSSAIKELARSLANDTSELLWISTKDIMKTKVVWASPDESVQQALIKLQQNDVGYLAVGNNEVLEGIVSKADVAGAMSPYLRPMFAKWRRPSDDATLKIKLKWIMSRPVRTARLDTPLATILENMCRFSGRALLVVDEKGKVHGLVTAFDIFQTLLNFGADVPTAGKAAQRPPL